MEQLLDTKEELNLVKLYKLKEKIYNSSFKRFIDIFEKIENINFGIDIKYEDIDFSTIIFNEKINDFLVQENIDFVNSFLDSTDEIINQKLEELDFIIKDCNDYSKLNKLNQEVVKDSYFLARYIQILCTTNIHETYLQNSSKILSSIDREISIKIWLSFKIYIKKLFKINN
ncbi:hypothetical protein [Aliarcobacter lanthieri]|uniref:hypothetical protein n=1 Tax=Aliarcobacter lanthieri TaxID=1355374 RepID=UPI003AAA60DB